MTCLVVRSLSGTWMKLHSSMLGNFFVYTLTLSMPIFKKKSSRRFLEKIPKISLKIGILSVKVYTKKVPNIEECNFIHAPLRIMSTKQVIVVLY